MQGNKNLVEFILKNPRKVALKTGHFLASFVIDFDVFLIFNGLKDTEICLKVNFAILKAKTVSMLAAMLCNSQNLSDTTVWLFDRPYQLELPRQGYLN